MHLEDKLTLVKNCLTEGNSILFKSITSNRNPSDSSLLKTCFYHIKSLNESIQHEKSHIVVTKENRPCELPRLYDYCKLDSKMCWKKTERWCRWVAYCLKIQSYLRNCYHNQVRKDSHHFLLFLRFPAVFHWETLKLPQAVMKGSRLQKQRKDAISRTYSKSQPL